MNAPRPPVLLPFRPRVQLTRDDSDVVRIRTEQGKIIFLPKHEAARQPTPLAA